MKLSLSFPVNPVKYNQLFGVKSPTYTTEGMLGHNGIDFTAHHGQPVYAAHDGLASFQIDSGGGHGVVIITNDQFDWQDGQAYFKTIYWHLADGLKEPQLASQYQDKTGFIPIKKGDLVGYADNTGQSTGDHLHFGLKPVAKSENWGTWANLAQTNGYYGAIDPMPYFETVQVLQQEIQNSQMTLIGLLSKYVDILRAKLGK